MTAPYRNPVLEQGDTHVNGPHQGGWVRTRGGEDWFLHFQVGPGFVPSGPVFAASPWRRVGAPLGLFAAAPEGPGHAGAATFSQFRISAQ